MKSVYQLKIIPRDLLFCRDAKPMEGSYAGRGGFLPTPATFHGAIIASLYDKFGKDAADQCVHNLRTTGVFPELDNEMYFPVPLDIVPPAEGSAKEEYRQLIPEMMRPGEISDLPEPLTHALFAPEASKRTVPGWISASQMVNYLAGKPFKLVDESVLFERECRPGIGMNASTRTAEDHKFYIAEYLRLRENVSLRGFVQSPEGALLDEMFACKEYSMLLGGQRCSMHTEAVRLQENALFFDDPLLQGRPRNNCVKWVLLTPGAWRCGFLPDFIDFENGRVLLPMETPLRKEGENRHVWRQRVANESVKFPSARLIAARIGKSTAISGWRMQEQNRSGRCSSTPRATRLFVPAGSVYYFVTDTPEEAVCLRKKLHGQAMSQYGGTAGYGLGVCGSFSL